MHPEVPHEIYVSWSSLVRSTSSPLQLFKKVEVLKSSEKALEFAGHLLVRLGGLPQNFELREVVVKGGVKGVEIYDHTSYVGIVVTGISLDEYSGREHLC